MKLPYGYILIGEEMVVHEEKAEMLSAVYLSTIFLEPAWEKLLMYPS